jgi:SAM-dependent methyltransferase
MDLKEEDILGDKIQSHWYYRAKCAALFKNLDGYQAREVLDIGAGSGFFSRMLLKSGGAERATCVDIGYAEDRSETHDGKQIDFRRSIEGSDADLVLLMDVLEHIPDERALLRSYVDLLPSGTRFILSVPAIQALWSAHDVFLGHCRRYSLEAFEEVVRSCGLVVDWGHYYYGAVLPIAASLRLLERRHAAGVVEPKSQLRVHSDVVNAVLWAACAAEVPVMRANRLAGLSVFVGAHKP